MNPYINEDVGWERLKDIQREMENSRLIAEHALPGLLRRTGNHDPARIENKKAAPGTARGVPMRRFWELASDLIWPFVRGVHPRWWS